MQKKLLSGNESIARGAWEAGVRTAFGYPGTPSTEILENLVKYPDVYCEWSPNEKVALESAVGSAIGGVRSMVTMKHVGLNVAADPLMTLSYIGVVAGLVLCVCDDPGQNSSQTEQDTRHYARLAKIPILEPGNAMECRDFMKKAFELSEQYRCPVILRSTTCVSHSRYLVEIGERLEKERIPFQKNPQQFVPVPIWGRKLRVKVEERMDLQAADASLSPMNQIFSRGKELGIISSGVAALHCLELFPDASVLKLGWAWPFPDELIRNFAARQEKLLVVEEGDPILEEHTKSLGLATHGRDIVPRTGELTPARIAEIKARLEGKKPEIPLPVQESADLPGRPPILCAGCPHRGVFMALAKFDVLVTGDIGCYTLGVFPPLSRTDLILCMGGGFTMAHGMTKAGETRPVVGIVGDSTFFHSGMTGLLNLVYNKGNATLIVVDNRTTAMTGHQDHPGTGKTLMGEPAVQASIEALAKACGLTRIRVVNPYDQTELNTILKEELYISEPSLIISRAPCILKERKPMGAPRQISQTNCKLCKACLNTGCPAIEFGGNMTKPQINALLCNGCALCVSVCKFHAIQ